MRYHLFQKFFGKMVKIKETSFLSAKKSSFSASHCMVCNITYQSWIDEGVDGSVRESIKKFENGSVDNCSKDQYESSNDGENCRHECSGLIVIQLQVLI